MSIFLENEWYVAAWSEEVGRTLLARRILDQRVVLYRMRDGRAVALADRCPHRSAPLSLGSLRDDCIECGYHGLTFDSSGRCVRVPGQDRIPPGAQVRSYPVLEQYGMVWIWPGEPVLADASRLIDIPQSASPRWSRSKGYTFFRSSYLNIADNLVDPAHTSFVHQRTIGNVAAEDVPITVEENERTILAGRWINDAPPVPIVRRFAQPKGNVDRWQLYNLRAPCISWVDFGSFDTGLPHTDKQREQAPYRVLSYAMLTPETASTTHYFWFQLRNFAVDDPSVTAEFEQLYAQTFDEDCALLDAIERVESESPGTAPVRIASDGGVVRLRRLIARLLDEEKAQQSGSKKRIV